MAAKSSILDEMATATAAADRCSSCKGPLDTKGLPKWCKDCRARWQRERRALENYRIDARSHAQGAREMKEMLAKMFDATGTAVYSARDVAALLRRMDNPKLLSPSNGYSGAGGNVDESGG